jgi:hypothetical protein
VFRVAKFRLYEGEYGASVRTAGVQDASGPRNLCANPDFASGTAPYYFNFTERLNVRRTFRRSSYTLTRLLANMGVTFSEPLLQRFHTPASTDGSDKRWLDGFYLDTPEEWDDPYRYFGW